ncbi:MAG: energy transducer TonB, partial [Flavobacteriaceae bacterium]|nr:energy transducer TonB [Flavobacteriaceae bacterium]
MKYFETKHEKDSAKITALITIILVLLLFIVGHDYMDPPEEYGIAVNFGTTDFGSGRIQPKEPIKSTPQEIKDTPKETTKEVRPKENVKKESPEEALTEDNEESIAMKKKKAKEDAERKAKEAAERAERERKEAEEKERKAQEAKKKALDNLIGGVSNSDGKATGSEGNDNLPGDEGQKNGNDPYAPYEGIPGFGNGGMGYGLNGRGKAKFGDYEGCTNEYGLVVVDIVVNQEGKVIKATPG